MLQKNLLLLLLLLLELKSLLLVVGHRSEHVLRVTPVQNPRPSFGLLTPTTTPYLVDFRCYHNITGIRESATFPSSEVRDGMSTRSVGPSRCCCGIGMSVTQTPFSPFESVLTAATSSATAPPSPTLCESSVVTTQSLDSRQNHSAKHKNTIKQLSLPTPAHFPPVVITCCGCCCSCCPILACAFVRWPF